MPLYIKFEAAEPLPRCGLPKAHGDKGLVRPTSLGDANAVRGMRCAHAALPTRGPPALRP
jgi:hypothetical protein